MRHSYSTLPTVVMLAVACGGGSKIVEPPPPPPPAGFSVSLKPDAGDLIAAQALGWTNGIPDADVSLMPKDSSAAARVVKSSAAGTADFGTVAPGVYVVEASRWLTSTEVAKLPAGQDVDGWVAKASVTLTAQGTVQQLMVPASRRKGLVISEWAFNIMAFPETGESYFYGGFLEVFNNADTTAYLDGLTIVQGFAQGFDSPTLPCSTYGTELGLDPAGIWTRHIQQFPGQGRDYPLLAGKSAVIAVDAIDHHEIGAKGIDLSSANFEFWGGPGDVDNPAVPNMIDTLSIAGDILGHGPVFQNSASVAVLARPYDKATSRRLLAIDGNEWAQVPGDRVIDVVSLYPKSPFTSPRCPAVINSIFDRQSSDVRGRDENVEYDFSVSRRAVPSAPSGRVILQDSRSSDADLVRTRRSPAAVP